jgi:HAD superfamily hydrolase (TIGR01484 family)
MKTLNTLEGGSIQYVFADIDDTITHHGKLPAASYEMLWKLQAAGIEVVPVTGRPAGWCDMIARFWPVRGVIGENGAFYFSYADKKMKRHWIFSSEERQINKKKLALIEKDVLKNVPGAAVSADQFCREFDLAIDFCEDVPPLKSEDIEQIVSIFEDHGAHAKVSSIHVNGWFGDYDKLSMCKNFCKNELGFNIDNNQKIVSFCGDSPNDEPMFGYFKNSVGVANVKEFEKKMKRLPKFICEGKGALGFVEFGAHLLKNRA